VRLGLAVAAAALLGWAVAMGLVVAGMTGVALVRSGRRSAP
jgi:hypothetical protein